MGEASGSSVEAPATVGSGEGVGLDTDACIVGLAVAGCSVGDASISLDGATTPAPTPPGAGTFERVQAKAANRQAASGSNTERWLDLISARNLIGRIAAGAGLELDPITGQAAVVDVAASARGPAIHDEGQLPIRRHPLAVVLA